VPNSAMYRPTRPHAGSVASSHLQKNAAGERERAHPESRARLLEAVIHDVQQQEDDEQRRGTMRRSVRSARSWFSYWPLHSMVMPGATGFAGDARLPPAQNHRGPRPATLACTEYRTGRFHCHFVRPDVAWNGSRPWPQLNEFSGGKWTPARPAEPLDVVAFMRRPIAPGSGNPFAAGNERW